MTSWILSFIPILMEARKMEDQDEGWSFVDACRRHIGEMAVVLVLSGLGIAALVKGIQRNNGHTDSMETSHLSDDINTRRTQLEQQLANLVSADGNGSIADSTKPAEQQIADCGQQVSQKTLRCLKGIRLPEADNDGL